MSLAPILIPYFMSGQMSHAQTASAPPNFSLDAAKAHLYLYSLLKTSRSIFTTRQFQKTNFTPRLRHYMISTKLRCPHCILAGEFAFKIRNLLYGILLVQFSLFGRTSSLTMFSLLTELLFALATYSVHHPTRIYLLHLLHLCLVKLHLPILRCSARLHSCASASLVRSTIRSSPSFSSCSATYKMSLTRSETSKSSRNGRNFPPLLPLPFRPLSSSPMTRTCTLTPTRPARRLASTSQTTGSVLLTYTGPISQRVVFRPGCGCPLHPHRWVLLLQGQASTTVPCSTHRGPSTHRRWLQPQHPSTNPVRRLPGPFLRRVHPCRSLCLRARHPRCRFYTFRPLFCLCRLLRPPWLHNEVQQRASHATLPIGPPARHHPRCPRSPQSHRVSPGRPLHWHPFPHPLRLFAQRSLSGTTIWLALRPAILVLVLFPVCSSIFNIVLYYYILISYILFHIAF